MYKKYESIQGEVAFRLWMFGLALAELKKAPNMSKAQNLLIKVNTFIESGIVEKQATTEQKDDLRTIASELETISK